jgi:segregation and condensation protein A
MLEKAFPWWRKALHFAMDSLRSGFGLFSRSARSDPGSEPAVSNRSEEGTEEALTDQPDNPEVLAAEPTPVPEPVAAVEPAPVAEPVPAPDSAAAEPIEAAPEPAVEPEAAAEPDVVVEPASDPISAPVEPQAEPVPDAVVTVPEPEPEIAEEPAVIEPVAIEPETKAELDSAAEIAGEAELTTEPVTTVEAEPEPAATAELVPTAEPPATVKPPIKSRDNEADLSPFSVIVSQVYDGPLDLLLDLIRKQDIDIYDIPIAKITAQFLAYVNQLKATDVDVAGEFIYTASLLIHIKSKMLLPRAAAGPDDAAEDPRRELVERLLEHERFKNAAQMLQQKQMLEAASWTNPGIREFKNDAAAEPEIAADTVDLVRIFRDILERARKRPVFNVDEDSVTVGQMIQFLARRLTMEDKPVALRRLLSHSRSERALVAMFLALLELVRLQAVLLRQDRAFSEIFIKKHTAFDTIMNDGLANAPHDEWR